MLFSLVNDKDIITKHDKTTVSFKNYTFSLFYYKLQIKIYKECNININNDDQSEIKQKLLDNNITILKSIKNDNIFKVNPLEFYYQYIFGYFARDDQLLMANKIFEDITGYNIQEEVEESLEEENEINKNNTLRLCKFIQIKNNVFKKIDPVKQPSIHNLIMGSGKTSMITPLVIIKFLQYLTTIEENSYSNCFIVLPEKLVNPSYDKLSGLLNLYFPINLQKCIEKRKNKDFIEITFFETFDLDKLDTINLNVFIISDISLKCAFINNYNLVLDERNKKNVYLFDEVDTILNPVTSELNYTTDKTTKLKNIEELYDLFYYIYDRIFNLKNSKFNDILCKYVGDYSLEPHFNIINSSSKLIDELKSWVKDIIYKFFNKKEKFYLCCFIKYDIKDFDLQSLTIDDLNLIYIINIFINVIFIPTLIYINRVNYGTYFGSNISENLIKNKENYIKKNEENIFDIEIFKSMDDNNRIEVIEPNCFSEESINIQNIKKTENNNLSKYLIIPFSNNEDPNIGSSFSNPLMTLCLTIINYIIRKGKSDIVDEEGLEIIFNIILREKIIEKELKKISERFKITDNQSFFELTDDEKKNIKNNECFLYFFCRDICINEIEIDNYRFNISGVDLFISYNIDKRSGFSGTINIPDIYDIDSNKQIIKEPDITTINDIECILKKCTIVTYDTNFTTELLKQIIESNNKICVFIDCGGIFVNTDINMIWDIIFNTINELNKKSREDIIPFEKLIYWNDDDKAISIDKNKNFQLWDRNSSIDGLYYYYDQKHTTGIDADIKKSSIGVVFINKSSRYRDVVQSMYRMRKLNIPDTTQSHKIIFYINKNVSKIINKNENINIDNFIEWINFNENKYYESQQISCQIQNINSISRIIKSFDPKYTSNISNIISCLFLSENNFREITTNDMDIILGSTTCIEKDIERNILVINQNSSNKINNKENIQKLIELCSKNLKNKSIINNLSINSQNFNQNQSVRQSIEELKTNIHSISENIDQINEEKNIDLSTFNIAIFDIFNYFEYNDPLFYVPKTEIIYYSVNFKMFENNFLPSIVIFYEKKLLLIPNIEGYKIIDWLKNYKIDLGDDFFILDSTGTLYFSWNKNNDIKLIRSYVRLMLVSETRRSNILTINDFINFIKYIKKMNIIEQSIKYIAEMSDKYISNYFTKALECYFNKDNNSKDNLLNHASEFYKFFIKNKDQEKIIKILDEELFSSND